MHFALAGTCVSDINPTVLHALTVAISCVIMDSSLVIVSAPSERV
jgi:hypothetical protein